MSQVAKRLKQEQDDKDLMIVLEDLPLVKVIVKLTMSTQFILHFDSYLYTSSSLN